MPQFNWLACGGLRNLSHDMCRTLKTRQTILQPDLNGFDKWAAKAKKFGFSVSSLLEDIATDYERKQELDLADFLIQMINEKPAF